MSGEARGREGARAGRRHSFEADRRSYAPLDQIDEDRDEEAGARADAEEPHDEAGDEEAQTHERDEDDEAGGVEGAQLDRAVERHPGGEEEEDAEEGTDQLHREGRTRV